MTSLQKFSKISLLAIFVFVSSLSMATAQRIATVDINAILESIPEYKQAQDNLDKISATWRQEIATEMDRVKGLYNKYQAEQVLLSEAQRKQREEEILAREKDVRESQKQKFGPEGMLFKKREELVRPIQDKVYAAIERYANQKGLDAVLDKSAVGSIVFASPRIDKTSDIIAELKK
jgi:outer membrane protein